MFKGQPSGLFTLAITNTGERFGYYTMLAIFMLFIQAKFGFSAAVAGNIYAGFLAAVYFMPLFGGIIADKIGYGKCVTVGIIVMLLGYSLLAIPTAADTKGMVMMFGALGLISIGTGLFKGNLQVMVGNLYDSPKYASKRDAAFSLFYMAINLGAMLAPYAAKTMTNYYLGARGFSYVPSAPALAHQFMDGTIQEEGLLHLQGIASSMPGAASMELGEFCQNYITYLSEAYNWGFAIACVSLVFSIVVYFLTRSTFKHADTAVGKKGAAVVEDNLTPEQTKSRITALLLVFAVVIFFWMAFHQNGVTMTFFAREYTSSHVDGILRIGFNIWSLILIAASVYTISTVFQSKTMTWRSFWCIVTLGLWGGAYALYSTMPATVDIHPSDFQQFNPFFVVALTPVSLAIFGWLASKGKEPSAPRKIGIGMVVAAIGFVFLMVCSLGLLSPKELNGNVSPDLVSPACLITTYLILTFAELLLSPMGISFVSKVAPPKYKGMMMGGWFVATAFGNYLVSIPANVWNVLPLWGVWLILVGVCSVSALFIFSIMRKLENATK